MGRLVCPVESDLPRDALPPGDDAFGYLPQDRGLDDGCVDPGMD